MSKSITIKVIAIILLIMAIFSYAKNIVNAKEIEGVDLYAKENLYCFKYKGVLCRTEFVVYKKDGIEYPAYCLNRELEGVSIKDGGYKVDIQELINNELVWKVIINGYPYKTYQELGCNSEMEAFTATKIAVYDMLYNYDWNDFESINETGERVIATIKRLSSIARNSSQTKINPNIEIISQEQEWKVDVEENKYLYKNFKINSNSEIANYIVDLGNTECKGIKIVDSNYNETNVFKESEIFKILVPIEELYEEKILNISVNANLKTYPIYYGKAPGNLQNYALSAAEYENITTSIEEKIDKNITNLKIKKIDKTTKEALENVEFIIVSDNTEYIKTTDANGIIELKSVLPGNYIIKEQKTKEGYVIDEKEYNVVLELNKQIELEIENEKKEEIKVVEKVKLPRTGF